MKTSVTALALVTFAILFGSVFAAEPETFTAKVVGVSDGDTLTVLDNAKNQTKIRLHGIDAPESKQDLGSRAKEALSSKLFGHEVRLVKRDVLLALFAAAHPAAFRDYGRLRVGESHRDFFGIRALRSPLIRFYFDGGAKT